MKRFLAAVCLMFSGLFFAQDSNATISSSYQLDPNSYISFGSIGAGWTLANDFPVFLDLWESDDLSGATMHLRGNYRDSSGAFHSFFLGMNGVAMNLNFGPGTGYGAVDSLNVGNIDLTQVGITGAGSYGYAFGITKVDTGLINPITQQKIYQIEGHGWLTDAGGTYMGDVHFTGKGGQTAVPEPATLSLIGAGLAGVASRRRKAKAA